MNPGHLPSTDETLLCTFGTCSMFIGVLFGAQDKAHMEVDNLLSLLGMAEEGGEDKKEKVYV